MSCDSNTNVPHLEIDDEVNDVINDFKQTTCNEPSRTQEIDIGIEYCRKKLNELLNGGKSHDEMSCDLKAQKKIYCDKIVQLGLERQSLQDENQEIQISNGHEFVVQSIRGRYNPCCEVCMYTIWRLFQTWYRCRVCGIRAHDKCSEEIKRTCAGVIASQPNFEVDLNIRKENSLADQKYKCAECFSNISYDGPVDEEARLCDYTGKLYCPHCHWNDTWSIPARIVHNLDANPRPVSRAVKQLLSIIDHRPLIEINEASVPIKYHKELRRVNELRRNFLLMKCYFTSCKTAKKLRILQYLKDHTHFVDSSTTYTIRELRELCSGSLLSDIEQIHSVFRQHIETECEICAGNGFFCELCDSKSNQLIFPFTENTKMCSKCFAVYHRKCFEKKSQHCPRCDRRKKRSVQEDISTAQIAN